MASAVSPGSRSSQVTDTVTDLRPAAAAAPASNICARLPPKLVSFTTCGSAGKRALKELETLRNNLAHTQEIIPTGWRRIALFSQRLEALLEGA